MHASRHRRDPVAVEQTLQDLSLTLGQVLELGKRLGHQAHVAPARGVAGITQFAQRSEQRLDCRLRRRRSAITGGAEECDGIRLIRIAGDTIVLSPPLIISDAQVGEVAERVGKTIKALA